MKRAACLSFAIAVAAIVALAAEYGVISYPWVMG